MMFSKAISTGLLSAALLGACSHAPPATVQPKQTGFAALADSIFFVGVRETQWGVAVWDQGRNAELYSHEAGRHFVPASNTKLVVTTVAVGLLGPEWRYSTPVEVAGAPGDSAPRALVIRASGDPSWSKRFFPSDNAVLDMIADSLWRNGVRRINGDVLVDASIFGREKIHSAWEIGDLPWYYATPTAAIAIAEASTRIVATSTAATSDVRFIDTSMPPLPVVNQIRMDTIGARNNLDIDYEVWPTTLTMTGTMPPNSADTSEIALPDPEMFATRALIDALKRRGISVTGNPRIVRDSGELRAFPQTRPVFAMQSPPLREIIGGLLKPSQNWIAEQLLKTLGAMKGRGGTWRGGLQVERRYLIDVAHIDSMQFSLSDGSGLSAQNLMTPRGFVMLLEHARTQPWGKAYYDALPKPGMRGGTLSSRLSGLESRVAAKTGSIANVNSLSGYVRTENGRDLTFSIVTNGSGRPSAEVRRAIDALVQAMARERVE